MAKRHYPNDGDLSVLAGLTIGVLGYGNQGRSQALNLADSGLDVVVGNRGDDYRERAEADGLTAVDIPTAVDRSDILLVILPDEVQPKVYSEVIEPRLKQGGTICFAHGYNVFYKGLVARPDMDVVMVAPKMIGPAVRTWYEDAKHFPSIIAVEQDASGIAMQKTLALALGMGGMGPAYESTFEEETITDLFGEQVGGGGALIGTIRSFQALVEAGYDPEVVQLELYGSGELAEVMKLQHDEGMIGQLDRHSPTSGYGQLLRASEMVDDDGVLEGARKVIGELKDGTFAKRWGKVQDDDYAEMHELRDKFSADPLFAAEEANRKTLAADITHGDNQRLAAAESNGDA
jgi:ketol-acid reductoisomerase